MTTIEVFKGSVEEAARDALRLVGAFSRLFPGLPPHQPDPADPEGSLLSLAESLYDGGLSDDVVELNGNLPAAYTFFSQLVAHDLAFDPTLPEQRPAHDGLPANMRTPRLDLDVIYGGDPDLNALYYESRDGKPTYRFRLGNEDGGPAHLAWDVPRSGGRALVPDPREDQHVIISQLHVAFMRLHNVMLDRVAPKGADRADFLEAQRLTRWYYQFTVLEDLLPRLLGRSQVASILKPARQRWLERQADMADLSRVTPAVPVEFSVAAFRVAHCAIRASYEINGRAGALPLFPRAGAPAANGRRPASLEGGKPLDKRLVVSWERLLEVSNRREVLQSSRAFGPLLAEGLRKVPGLDAKGGLAGRDLVRGWRLDLPSGQAVARRLGDREEELIAGDDPLWYYVMKEVPDGGHCIGPVAARILCKVFLDLLHLDPASYLARNPVWTPDDVKPQNALMHVMHLAGMPFADDETDPTD